MDNPVGWFEIYVEDMARAKAFYERVLAVELSPLEVPDAEMLTFPMKHDGSGATGALVRMAGVRPGAGGILIYFVCDDCAAEAARAAEAGGKLHKAKTSIGQYGHIALVFDTEGNMIGLHSMQ